MILALLALTALAAPSEEAMWAAWEEGELLTAGRLADEVLEARPRSLQGHFVKGYVLWKEEGEHAGAKHYLDKADALYWKVNPSNAPEGPWLVHYQITLARIDVASEMGQPAEQLALIDRYNELFTPKLDVERAWPLMKLGRFPKAREAAMIGVDSPDYWKRSYGLNSMCAIESEALNRVAGFDWCLQALEQERAAEHPDLTVDASNASGAALGILDFDKSLELAREATRGSTMTAANPYKALVAHHTRAARGADALQAVEGLVQWRSRQPPSMRDLARAGADETLAAFLLAAGRSERARELIDRAIQFPDRAGLTSSEPLQAEGRHAALRLAIRRLEAERAHEEAATLGLFGRLGHWLASWLPDTGVWEDRATLRRALTDERRQRATFRVYMDGGLGLEPWAMAWLPEDVGQGVFSAAVDRAAEEDATLEASAPATLAALPAYYAGLRASAAFHERDWSATRALASEALTGLPPAEVLLRAQLHAMAGEAAWRQGEEDVAVAAFTQAMQLDPGSLRRLSIALPARVSASSGDDVTAYVEAMLGRSPRLRAGHDAFQVVVSGGGDAVRICLRDPYGTQIACSEAGPVPAPAPEEGEEEGEAEPFAPTDWERARHHVLAWSERAFALPTGSSVVDLDSLDGTTLKRGPLAGEAIDAILDGR